MSERFAPGVVMHGITYTPPGWMWVLGFALGGCDWAIKEASTPEFRAIVREHYRDLKRLNMEHEIGQLEARIADLKRELRL